VREARRSLRLPAGLLAELAARLVQQVLGLRLASPVTRDASLLALSATLRASSLAVPTTWRPCSFASSALEEEGVPVPLPPL